MEALVIYEKRRAVLGEVDLFVVPTSYLMELTHDMIIHVLWAAVYYALYILESIVAYSQVCKEHNKQYRWMLPALCSLHT